jgi:hypothetical protein
MGCGHGSSRRAPAWQMQGLEFKIQHHTKKKKKVVSEDFTPRKWWSTCHHKTLLNQQIFVCNTFIYPHISIIMIHIGQRIIMKMERKIIFLRVIKSISDIP